MISYFESKSLLSEFQFGFRKNKSTIRALIFFLEEVVNTLDDSLSTVATMCDLTKAFDCVPTDFLLNKLEFYGNRGKELDLLTSYLKNRMQYVVYGDKTSTLRPTSSGAPQGSILGPILLNIYINGLASAIENFCMLFADDIRFLSIGKRKGDTTPIGAWFSANLLKMNESKTKHLLIRNGQLNRNQSNYRAYI